MSNDVLTDDVLNASDTSVSPDPPLQDSASPSPDNTRRGFFKIASIVLGMVAGIGPALIGLIAFLDPLRRTPAKPDLYQKGASGEGEGLIRVASMDALSVDAPQRFLVIDDQIDAWNFTPDQPIGAVYIEKLSDSEVRVFNTTCPHAGCSVACNGSAYHCPCHNSSFNLDGSKLVSESGRENPSPRDLDALEYVLRDGEIWVKFQNFYTGKHEKKVKV